jgi:hypothetical protein
MWFKNIKSDSQFYEKRRNKHTRIPEF